MKKAAKPPLFKYKELYDPLTDLLPSTQHEKARLYAESDAIFFVKKTLKTVYCKPLFLLYNQLLTWDC